MKTIISSEDITLINLKEIINYSSLLNNLAKRDFLVRYKQAFAGIMWALIKPLINVLVFGFIASKINSTESTITNFVYVASAMLLWQLFSSVFNNSSLYTKFP